MTSSEDLKKIVNRAKDNLKMVDWLVQFANYDADLPNYKRKLEDAINLSESFLIKQNNGESLLNVESFDKIKKFKEFSNEFELSSMESKLVSASTSYLTQINNLILEKDNNNISSTDLVKNIIQKRYEYEFLKEELGKLSNDFNSPISPSIQTFMTTTEEMFSNVFVKYKNESSIDNAEIEEFLNNTTFQSVQNDVIIQSRIDSNNQLENDINQTDVVFDEQIHQCVESFKKLDSALEGLDASNQNIHVDMDELKSVIISLHDNVEILNRADINEITSFNKDDEQKLEKAVNDSAYDLINYNEELCRNMLGELKEMGNSSIIGDDYKKIIAQTMQSMMNVVSLDTSSILTLKNEINEFEQSLSNSMENSSNSSAENMTKSLDNSSFSQEKDNSELGGVHL